MYAGLQLNKTLGNRRKMVLVLSLGSCQTITLEVRVHPVPET